MALYKRDGIYYYKYLNFKGEQRRKSTGKRYIQEATRWLQTFDPDKEDREQVKLKFAIQHFINT